MLEVAAEVRALSRRSALAWGAGVFALGASLSLIAMTARPERVGLRWLTTTGALLGVLLASGGALAWIGNVRGPHPASPEVVRVRVRALAPALLQVGGCGLALTLLVNRALAGVVPAAAITLGIAVPALSLGMLWGTARGARVLMGPHGPERRPLFEPLWPSALAMVAYLPSLGSFGMLDPWESQYSEVAREMLARHDWISLWWRDRAYFWSKPVLDFWLEGLGFSWFGLDPRPECMLSGVAAGRQPAPEWAARLPIVASAIAGQWVLGRGVERHYGRRAARFAELILITCPYWFLLARQTMVDMAYAAPLAATLGCLLLADASGDGERVRSYRLELGGRALALSAYHVLFIAIAALALAQIFYLLSRHASFDAGGVLGVRLHLDQVWRGSPGNCALPGNEACQLDVGATQTRLQPGLSALAWAACLGALLWHERHERRQRALYQLAAWACVALAVMGKAAPGLVLPLASFGAWMMLKGRLGELREAKLLGLGLILACVAAPWFVQEYARNGLPFLHRLFVHDMVNRAFGHVHDTNAGTDTSFRYYVWQLGYGLFPWTGVAAVGVLFCIGKSARPEADARFVSATQLFVAWLLACFGMFSIAGTKFHHYILPLVPAAAVLAGVFCAELWAGARGFRVAGLGLLAAVPTLLVARDLAAPGSMPGAANLLHLFIYKYDRPWPAELVYPRTFLAFGAVTAVFCFAIEARRARRVALAGLSGCAVAFAAWCVNVYLLEVAPHWTQRHTISEYYRARSGPEQLLVAYRQNWMGENFYTSNHVATFKAGGDAFKRWIEERRRQDKRVLFFTTEHGTVPLLKRELGAVSRFDLLTTAELNNKFALARVEL